MQKSTTNMIMGSLLAFGAALAVNTYFSKKKEFKVLPDTDVKNSTKLDEMESVKAKTDPEEKGLTQLDSIYRAEWVANGFPQTHAEMERLEEESNKNQLH